MFSSRGLVAAAVIAAAFVSTRARAQDAAGTAAPDEPAPRAADEAPARRWWAHLNVGMPVYTSVSAWTNPAGGSVPSQSFSPGDRLALVELIGAGYWVHPHIRLNLSVQFAETLTSQPANPAKPKGPQTLTGLTFAGAIAWAALTEGPFFVGMGPMAGPRWMGNTAKEWVFGDVGLFSCLGAAARLPSDFALALAVQLPVTFNPALNFSIVPALALSRRF
jgi:hypothetical protein